MKKYSAKIIKSYDYIVTSKSVNALTGEKVAANFADYQAFYNQQF